MTKVSIYIVFSFIFFLILGVVVKDYINYNICVRLIIFICISIGLFVLYSNNVEKIKKDFNIKRKRSLKRSFYKFADSNPKCDTFVVS